jgi:predicted DNA-binding ribbon-helix-helix protein
MQFMVKSITVNKLLNVKVWNQILESTEHKTLEIYKRRVTLHNITLQVAGRRNSKVTTTYFWNVRNKTLTNRRDLITPSTAATLWDSKGRLGNLTSIRVKRFSRIVWHQISVNNTKYFEEIHSN